MTTAVLDNASMAATVLRVRDVAAAVSWYREKLGLEPIHVGSDGPDHPTAAYAIAGSVVSLWQLPPGQARTTKDNDRNSYVVLVMTGDLDPVRRTLLERGVEVGDISRSAHYEFVWFHDLDGNRFELSRALNPDGANGDG